MLYEVNWADDGTYVPGEEYSPERFFDDGLKNSTEFDLKLGYFSSAAISVLAEGFATFISRGGYMRLIINHIVSKKDKEAITNGVMGNVIDCSDLSNFQYLKTTFNEYQEQFFRCLAYMISQKRIDIRIIKPSHHPNNIINIPGFIRTSVHLTENAAPIPLLQFFFYAGYLDAVVIGKQRA